MLKDGVWMLAVIPALFAGFTDWQWRRIPNWLTLSSLLLGFAFQTLARGWPGARDSLLGAALGLGLLLPLVVMRSFGGGDWKLVGALGAFLGPLRLIHVLAASVFVAAAMAVVLIIWKRRVWQTLRNLAHLVGSLFRLRLPGPDLTLDNPDALKVPFGVAVAFAVVFYTGGAFLHLF